VEGGKECTDFFVSWGDRRTNTVTKRGALDKLRRSAGKGTGAKVSLGGSRKIAFLLGKGKQKNKREAKILGQTIGSPQK